jgi:colicin import membrane protein
MSSRLVLALALVAAVLPARSRAADLNVITAVEVKDEGASVVLSVKGSKKPSFTTFSMADPPRFVIDFSESKFDGVAEDMQIQDGTINVVKNLSYGSDATSIARVMIAFAVEVGPPDVLDSGETLVVRIPKPSGAAVPAAVAAAGDEAKRAQGAEAARARAEDEARADADRKASEVVEARAAAQSEERARDAADAKERASAQARAEADAAARAKAEDEERLAAQTRSRDVKARAETERSASKLDDEPGAAPEAEVEIRGSESRAASGDAVAKARVEAERRAEAEATAQVEAKAEAAAQAEVTAEAVAQVAASAEAVEREELARRAQVDTERERAVVAAEAAQQEPRAVVAEVAPTQEAAPEPAKGPEPEQRAPAVAEHLEAGAPSAQLREVGFKQLAGVSRVFVRTSVAPRFTITDAGENVIRLELENTRTDRKNDLRFLDTSFFSSSVAMVTPSRIGTSYVVDIKLKQKVPYQQKIEGDVLALDFERPVTTASAALAPAAPEDAPGLDAAPPVDTEAAAADAPPAGPEARAAH